MSHIVHVAYASRVNSKMTLWRVFCCCKFVFKVCLSVDSETSHFWSKRQKRPIPPPKWLLVSTNQGCSFNCKWLHDMETTIFEAPTKGSSQSELCSFNWKWLSAMEATIFKSPTCKTSFRVVWHLESLQIASEAPRCEHSPDFFPTNYCQRRLWHHFPFPADTNLTSSSLPACTATCRLWSVRCFAALSGSPPP